MTYWRNGEDKRHQGRRTVSQDNFRPALLNEKVHPRDLLRGGKPGGKERKSEKGRRSWKTSVGPERGGSPKVRR